MKEVSKGELNEEKMKEVVCVFVFISSWRCNPSAGEAGDVSWTLMSIWDSKSFVSECSNGMRSTYFEWISLLAKSRIVIMCVCYSV